MQTENCLILVSAIIILSTLQTMMVKDDIFVWIFYVLILSYNLFLTGFVIYNIIYRRTLINKTGRI